MTAFLKVDLVGADVPLTFSCTFKAPESEWPGLCLSVHVGCFMFFVCIIIDVVEAHCYFFDIGQTYREQIRSRINNN